MLKWVHHTPSLKNHTTVITREDSEKINKEEEEEEEEDEKIVNDVKDKIEFDSTDCEDKESVGQDKDENMIDISLKRRLGVRKPEILS